MLGGNIIKHILFFLIFVVLVAVVFFGIEWFSHSVGDIFAHKLVSSLSKSSLADSVPNVSASTQKQQLAVSPPQNSLQKPMRILEVPDLTSGAVAATSVDVNAGQPITLFGQNENKKLPIASLTKLMTALVVLQYYDLNHQVIIDQGAMSQEGEQGDLKLGQVLSVKNLLYIALMESSNRAAYQLSEVAGVNSFVGLMNQDAQNLGLTNTHFLDSTGLDDNSYSTVQDLVTLTRYLFDNYLLFRQITGVKNYDLYMPDGTFHHTPVSTDNLLGTDGIISGKTGYTYGANGCFMVVSLLPTSQGPLAVLPSGQDELQKGNYIISVVLGANDRSLEMKKILDWDSLAYHW